MKFGHSLPSPKLYIAGTWYLEVYHFNFKGGSIFSEQWLSHAVISSRDSLS